MSKKILVVGIILVVIVCAIGVYFFNRAINFWYTAYEGPRVEQVGDKTQLHFTTLDSLETMCKELSKHPEFEDRAESVLRRIPELRNSLKVLENPSADIQVDFIAMIHYSGFTDDRDFFEAVKLSQGDVKKMLLEKKYDVIGKESHWSGDINTETIIDENWVGMDKEDYPMPSKDSIQFRDTVREILQEHQQYDGIMQLKKEVPQIAITGIEDMDIYFLHEKVNEWMRTTSGLKTKAYLMRVDQTLVWLRTEIALAKMLTYLKARKLSRGVVVMGQSHRFAAEVLTKKVKLNGQNFNSVPLSYKDDEAQ